MLRNAARPSELGGASMKRPPACTRCENKCFRVASIIAPGATTAGGGPARSARDVFIPIQALGFWPVPVVPASPLQTHQSAPPLPVHPVVLCLPAMQRGRPMQRARHQLWRGCRRWPSWKAAEAWKVATPRFHARSSEGAPLRLGTQAQQAVPAGAGAADAGQVRACCVRGVGVRCAWSRAATPESGGLFLPVSFALIVVSFCSFAVRLPLLASCFLSCFSLLFSSSSLRFVSYRSRRAVFLDSALALVFLRIVSCFAI